MFRSHGRPPSVFRYLTLPFALLVLTTAASAQIASAPNDTSTTTTTAAPSQPAPSPETNTPAAGEAATATAEAADEAAAPAKLVTVPAPVDEATTAPAATATTAAAPETPAPIPTRAAVVQGTCKRFIDADVTALAQPYMLNRLGAVMPHAVIYALSHDVTPPPADYATNVTLQPWKRARPIVLRANQGDCLRVKLTNLINLDAGGSSTGPVSLHAQGMQLVNSIADDGSFVGVNTSSLVDPLKSRPYTLLAQQEGTYLLYSEGDTSTLGQQLQHGLFGAVNVQPEGAEWYRSQVTKEDLDLATAKDSNGKPRLTPAGQPVINYAARYPADTAKYGARACAPVLQMAAPEMVPVGGQCQPKPNGVPLRLYHTDLTAVITGPKAGRFPGTTGVGKPEPTCQTTDGQARPGINPLFCGNPTLPDRKQPYREITVIYHEVTVAVQAFPIFQPGNVQDPANPNDPTKTIPNPAMPTVEAGQDLFAINYGTGGIGAEIYANRIGVGPMANCIDCKFEEFFLTSWAVGDPAMVVDTPANYAFALPAAPPACNPETLKTPDNKNNCLVTATRPLVQAMTTPPPPPPATRKATMAFYPDDPSNVYHSYLNDHVKFRILHGGTGVTHVHHQHAHQWLQSPNSMDGSYLDSQFISPGASYTLEMVYNGSGNRNKTIGDSIFHCHFYPHFAAGMWSMWRVHDVFEAGTELDPDGKPVKGARALPDGEIAAGTPIPALVPMPTLPMALMPSKLFIDNGQVVFGQPNGVGPLAPDPTGKNVKSNPGYPFFIPGVAGFRPPHPPLDFAPDTVNGGLLDGGLPRHVNVGGTAEHEMVFTSDVNNWSKDFVTLESKQLPEDGTAVEKVAIAANGRRCNPSFMPDGTTNNPFGPTNYPECGAGAAKAQFIMNGLPRKTPQNPSGAQLGSPFADPAVTNTGQAVGTLRRYKAAALQTDVTFNKQGWHFPQQRLLTLWQDVAPTLNGQRPPEPLFFRANSRNDFVEFWHTNLVPNYYDLDKFQVRTPTDIIGQHIHNVKFDVTSSDGAANGWNYEDGTLSPGEVQDVITAINKAGGITRPDGTKGTLKATLPPKDILDCTAAQNANDVRCKPCPPPAAGGPACLSWIGAQTTVQRWYVDPFDGSGGKDNTMRTVFTHDHFGPSTHQQAGLYAGLVIEPENSKWTSNDGATPFYTRPDGGPTSWQARIITQNKADSYREFVLEFQDFALAYTATLTSSTNPGGQLSDVAINPPPGPTLISTGGQPPPGTQSVNYYNAPIPFRTQGNCTLTDSFSSSCKPVDSPGFTANGDPLTPVMRAYEGDKVQVRTLVGAHTFSHFFTMYGPRWHFEPSWTNSGFRNSQGMGISEHFEMLFNVPPSSIAQGNRKCPDGKSQGNCVDYLYVPSDDNFGLANGVWGLLRAYDPTKAAATGVAPLPVESNPLVPGKSLPFEPCPATAPKRNYNVSAVTAKTALPDGRMLFNARGTNTDGTLIQSLGMMYVFTEDLAPGTRRLKGPVEPLILRANAGDCVVVTLTNELDTTAPPFTTPLTMPKPFDGVPVKTPTYVGLHPQLLSYDGATDGGINIGYNANQTVAPGQQIKYTWYAGAVNRTATGALNYTPVEFGSLNLMPADPIVQHVWGLYGAMVIEPKGATWKCDAVNSAGAKVQVPCEPAAGFDPSTVKGYTRASATVSSPAGGLLFREFVAMTSEDVKLNDGNRSAVNYRVEPTYFRFGNTNANKPEFASVNPPGSGNNSCALANLLVGGDPQTPVFTAVAGQPFRFRLLHPQGTGTAQVFVLNGHVWQREPYTQNSTVIGNNPLSQWMGSHDSYGGTDHYDIVVASAGGVNKVPGDYLYTTFVPNQNLFGSWGIFRVLDAQGNVVKGNQPAGPQVCPSVPGKPHGAGNPNQNIQRFIRQPFGTR